MSKNWIIGVDIGGTKISAGLLTRQGKIKNVVTVPTMADKSKSVVLNQVQTVIEELLEINKVEISTLAGIGICAPGPLNPRTGLLINPPNLPSLWNVNLKDSIQQIYPLEVLIENDANAAALAEVKIGAAKGCKNILYVTVSTGIGTGLIINGSVYHGKNGFAGEGGHISTNYLEEVHCNCHAPGCLESVASGTAIARKARHLLEINNALDSLLEEYRDKQNLINTKIIADMAQKNDKVALKLIEDATFSIGAWLGGMINLLDPEMIVIGGGVSQIGPVFFDQLKTVALKYTYNPYAEKTPIIPAFLKADVGIYGAASLFIDSNS
jgi:glucokinase